MGHLECEMSRRRRGKEQSDSVGCNEKEDLGVCLKLANSMFVPLGYRPSKCCSDNKILLLKF